MKTLENDQIAGLGPVSNGGKKTYSSQLPYRVLFSLRGDAPILFHRWCCEAVEAKANAPKGSEEKKSDNIESYVYRAGDGSLCLPGEYVRQACIVASKSLRDPRSPRKSMLDVMKASLIAVTDLASLGVKNWDYLDKRRVTVGKGAAISRIRPALHEGWEAEFIFQVISPEYVPAKVFHDVLNMAGRFIGVGDYRPSYGRFSVTHFEVLDK